MISHEDLKRLETQGITFHDLIALKEKGVEWVSSTDKRAGYFRKITKNRTDPSYRQLQHRILFSKVSYAGFGQTGVEETSDGRLVAKHAMQLGRTMNGISQPKRELSLQEKLIKLILER